MLLENEDMTKDGYNLAKAKLFGKSGSFAKLYKVLPKCIVF